MESFHAISTEQVELPHDQVANRRKLISEDNPLCQLYACAKPMVTRIIVIQQQIAAAREARDRLLPKLMSGEIEV